MAVPSIQRGGNGGSGGFGFGMMSSSFQREASPKELAEFEQGWVDIDPQLIEFGMNLATGHPTIRTVTDYLLNVVFQKGIRIKEKTPVFPGQSQRQEFERWFSNSTRPVLERAMQHCLAFGWCHSTTTPHEKFGAQLELVDPRSVIYQQKSNALGRRMIRIKQSDFYNSLTDNRSSTNRALGMLTDGGGGRSKKDKSEYIVDGYSLSKLDSVKPTSKFRYREPQIYMWMYREPTETGMLTSPIMALLEDLAFGRFLRSTATALLERQKTPLFFITQEEKKYNDSLLAAGDMAESALPRCIEGGSTTTTATTSTSSAVVPYQQQMRLAANRVASNLLTAQNRNQNYSVATLSQQQQLMNQQQQNQNAFKAHRLQPGQKISNGDNPPDPPNTNEYEEKLNEKISNYLGVPEMCYKRTKNVVLSKQTNAEDTADKLLSATCQGWVDRLFRPMLVTFYFEAFLHEHKVMEAAKETKALQRKEEEEEEREARRIRKAEKEDGEVSSSSDSDNEQTKKGKKRKQRDSSSSEEEESESDSNDESSSDEEAESGYSDKRDKWGCEIHFDSLVKREDVEQLYDQGLLDLDVYRRYRSIQSNIPLSDIRKQPQQPQFTKEGLLMAAEVDARVKLDKAKAQTEKQKPEMEREKMKHDETKALLAENKVKMDMQKMDKSLTYETQKFKLEKQKDSYKDKRELKKERKAKRKEQSKKKKKKKRKT